MVVDPEKSKTISIHKKKNSLLMDREIYFMEAPVLENFIKSLSSLKKRDQSKTKKSRYPAPPREAPARAFLKLKRARARFCERNIY